MSTEEYIRQLVATWPPFTPQQRDHLRVLLRTEPRQEAPALRSAA
ncbi:hypothetical protein [Streptomyces canus]